MIPERVEELAEMRSRGGRVTAEKQAAQAAGSLRTDSGSASWAMTSETTKPCFAPEGMAHGSAHVTMAKPVRAGKNAKIGAIRNRKGRALPGTRFLCSSCLRR